MSRLNTPSQADRPRTHEGAPARRLTAIQALRRTVLSALLWEDTFYEFGSEGAQRIRAQVARLAETDPDLETVAAMAVEAREEQHLRHVPLLLVRELARFSSPRTAQTLARVIRRPDELGEFVRMYWEGSTEGPALSNQVKKGLAEAFRKFDRYQLAKWSTGDTRKGGVQGRTVSLLDVMRLVHPKPKDAAQAKLWADLKAAPLAPPDTWETRLSGGESAKSAFLDLLERNKLGYMALLRNLRKMDMEGVDSDLVRQRLLEGAQKAQALPFRFIAAARAAPRLEPTLDQAMIESMGAMDRLPGKTLVLVDHSGSMSAPVSRRSDMRRWDAAAGLAVLLAGVAQECEVWSFGTDIQAVPPRQGMALIDAIHKARVGMSTNLGKAVKNALVEDWDRLVVITDEQSGDRVPEPSTAKPAYMINVAPYEHGVGYGSWVHIDGFSEATLKFIQALESEELS